MSNNRNEFVNSLKVDNRRKIKNKPSNKKHTPTKDINRKIAAIIAAVGLMGLGMTGCKQPEKAQEGNINSTQTYTTTITAKETLEDSIKKAEQDFLTRYLKAYNVKNDTYYLTGEAEIVTNSLKEGIVYVVDGKRVTCGKFPALVKQELSDHGEVTTEEGHDKVMQILVNREDKTILLGTYDSSTLEPIYSGSELGNILDKKVYDFKDLGIEEELAKSMSALSAAKGVENTDSLKMRLDRYKKQAEHENNKGFEIGD